MFYLNSEQNNADEINKEISKISNFDENNLGDIINIMKIPISYPENKIKVSFTYFKMWDIIIKISEKDFFVFLKKIATIKSDIETYPFLKYISYLGNGINKRLASFSQLSSKWKFFGISL